MTDPGRSDALALPIRALDVPVEVTLTDGSRWIVYYRISGGYARALEYVAQDISAGRLKPADDVDGIQRRGAQINMAYVVAVRDGSAPNA